ncbi:unnamed protein product [Protopolystoma xenopodis]|uniref:Uncharacterized protein n=1 Tax=Protopolystoma xenopodis TaxID=117903 RepID=A0A448WSH5_9PLAT|nr:unnamed protein product [Protopolystoma xenopodis]
MNILYSLHALRLSMATVLANNAAGPLATFSKVDALIALTSNIVASLPHLLSPPIQSRISSASTPFKIKPVGSDTLIKDVFGQETCMSQIASVDKFNKCEKKSLNLGTSVIKEIRPSLVTESCELTGLANSTENDSKISSNNQLEFNGLNSTQIIEERLRMGRATMRQGKTLQDASEISTAEWNEFKHSSASNEGTFTSNQSKFVIDGPAFPVNALSCSAVSKPTFEISHSIGSFDDGQ